jgi:hypothetical protein
LVSKAVLAIERRFDQVKRQFESETFLRAEFHETQVKQGFQRVLVFE